jgi:hypothetical protein
MNVRSLLVSALVTCCGVSAYSAAALMQSPQKATAIVQGNSIFISGMSVVSREDLPRKSHLVPSLDLERRELAAPEVKGDQLAFIVRGGVQEWLALTNLKTKHTRDIVLVDRGTIDRFQWGPDGLHLAVETTPANGTRAIVIAAVDPLKKLVAMPSLTPDKPAETYDAEWLTDNTLNFKSKHIDETVEAALNLNIVTMRVRRR